jgi:Kef-type K+ transport system membrane component KefB
MAEPTTTLSSLSASAASAPLWSLEMLRGAEPVLALAIIMLLGVVAADLLHRFVRLPRACGWMLVGALASPLALRLINRTEIDPLKPLIDLAIGMLVFELGSRIRPRWLYDNGWFALASVLEGLLAGIGVFAALIALDAPAVAAGVAGAVAMSTSPVVTLAVLHEARPRGQVTERLMMMTAVNSALAMLALNAAGVMALAAGPDVFGLASNAAYVVFGSFLLGTAVAGVLHWLSKTLRGAGPVLQMTLVILAALLAARWSLSPLLALLVAGVMARRWLGHRLSVEPNFGSAGAALTVLLFISIGVMFTLDGFGSVWPWVLAIVLARAAGKGIAIAATARASGLGWRQAGALTLALQPMSSLAVLLAADTFGWPTQLPRMDAGVLQALLASTTLMQFSGPLWTLLGLRQVAGEIDAGGPPRAAG